MSSSLTSDSARAALSRIVDPDFRKDLVSLAVVKSLTLDGVA